MKRVILFILCLAITAYSLKAKETELIVYRLSGKVSLCIKSKQRLLKLKERISADCEINIEYESMVELLDTKNAKRYTIKTPGKGAVALLLKKRGNSISALTQQYISYVQNQLKNNTNIAQTQRFTDFATVTRAIASIDNDHNDKDTDTLEHLIHAENRSIFIEMAGGAYRNTSQATLKNKSSQAVGFDEYKRHAMKKFEDYRSIQNSKYNDFVRSTWNNCHASVASSEQPKEHMTPVCSTEKDSTGSSLVLGWVQKSCDSIQHEAASDDKTYASIKEIKPTAEELTYQPMPFIYNHMEMSVRLDESKRFNIGELSPNKVGDLLDMLNTINYDNAILDCLQLKRQHNLDDWNFLMMLHEMGQQFCGPGTNEATLLAGYMLSQTGYKMRYAMANDRLYLLVCTNSTIHGLPSFEIDGLRYYPIDKQTPQNILVCKAAMPYEKPLDIDK